MENTYDLIVIGGGPAGLTSAIYASRAGMKTAVIEKAAPGGKLNNTHKVDNYPGMEGKAGWEFSMSFTNQAKNFGAEIIGGEVTSISNLESKEEKKVVLANGTEYTTKTIIIATGLQPMKMDVPGAEEFFGKGVSTCVVCDGAFYRGKDVVIVGGGNSATEESLFAAGIVNKVYIVNQFPGFKAEQATLDKLASLENVEVMHNTDYKEVIGKDGRVAGFVVENKETNETRTLEVSGIFTYIGWLPETQFMKESGLLNEEGYIEISEGGKTKFPGVYSAGDVTPKPFRQITVATSEGTNAALSAVNYFNTL